ncbi:RNA demethylase ALKBH10B [Linum grandiflorum]
MTDRMITSRFSLLFIGGGSIGSRFSGCRSTTPSLMSPPRSGESPRGKCWRGKKRIRQTWLQRRRRMRNRMRIVKLWRKRWRWRTIRRTAVIMVPIQVNVVKGLKLFEQVFTDSELSKLTHFVDELRLAGQKGELSGDTFILFNKQMKGNKRELIQFGVPIFEHIKEDASNQTCNIEPIPALLEGVINHLVQWRLIPEYRRPNGCIIHFFDEEEFSQPFQKPPHVEQPVATLLLSESTMAFGRNIAGDSEGNYRGSLVLSLKQGSLLVMRGNSAEMARHVMCPSQNKRVSITFFRVREEPIQTQSPPTSPMHGGALTVWQPATLINNGYGGSSLINNGFGGVGTMANWGHLIRTPFVMVAAPPMAQPQLMVSPKKIMPPLAQGGGGTGVFLPWARMGSRRPPKHLPPRAQRSRYLALPSGRRTANPTSSEGEKST